MIGIMNGVSGVLEQLAEDLDISEAALKAATDRYNSMGNWLNRPDSALARFRPIIYAQGSINLGTVVKPTTDLDQYDIDLVCEILREKSSISQEKLKGLIGTEVKSYAKANSMNNQASEGRRCWTIDYAENARFHMDILPALQDLQQAGQLKSPLNLGTQNFHQYSINITDNTHPNYRLISEHWPQSNPRGYAKWFHQQMLIQFNERRRVLAESRKKEIHEIPEYAVKTTLQRVIQLLKRHRDTMFAENPEHKPISIIITTLAAQAYNNESDLAQALINIIQKLPKLIEYRDGEVWISNPVNPLENFADRWAEIPERNETFFQWATAAEEMLTGALSAKNPSILNERLSATFGKPIVEKALAKRPVSPQYFPLPYAAVRVNESETRFQVQHRQQPAWPMLATGEVRIGAKFKRGSSWLDFSSDSKPLPKRSGLKFKALTNVSGPFEVHWQVVNTGEEAVRANSLRGTIFSSPGNGEDALLRQESTSYKGMHWIKCYLVKSGYCVAKSEPFIVNIA